MNRQRAMWIVFAVALVVRLGVAALVLPGLKTDTNPDYYRELGRNVLAGKGFVAVAPDGRELPNVNRPLAYPVFLAGVMAVGGDRLGVIAVANCLLAAVGCALVVWWASRWLTPGAALAAGLIVALEPNTILRCAVPMVEPLFTLWVVMGAGLLTWHREKTWSWAGAGVCWGLAALTRVVAIWLWPVALVVVLATQVSWRRRAVWFAVFVLGFGSLVGMWMARNATVTGYWIFSTSGRYYMVSNWAASLEARRAGEPVEAAQKKIWARTGSTEFCAGREELERMWRKQEAVLREVRDAAPLWLAVHSARGAGETLLGPGRRALETMSREPGKGRQRWAWWYSTGLAGLLALAAWGAMRRWRELWLVAVLAGYFVVFTVGPIGNSRFRYPMVPMLAILAVAGLSRVKEESCSKTSS